MMQCTQRKYITTDIKTSTNKKNQKKFASWLLIKNVRKNKLIHNRLDYI